MNKTKKVLSIILITLLILSTVFTLMKKVGLCASSSPDANLLNISDFPFPYGDTTINDDTFTIGCFPYSVPYSSIQEMLYDYSHNIAAVGADTILLGEVNTTSKFISLSLLSYCYISNITDISGSSDFIDKRITFTWTYTCSYYYYYESNTWTRGDYYLNGGTSVCDISNFGYGLDSSKFDLFLSSSYYPIWTNSDSAFTFNSNVIFDTYSGGGSSGGTDSPGFNHYFWENYQDSIDDVDNNNNIWKPNYQNPSNQQGFWDNVTDFFNRSFKSLLGGISGSVKTIGDYFEQFYNGCMEFWTRCWDTLFGWLSGLKDNTDDISDDTSVISGTVSSIDGRLSTFFNNFWSNFDDHLEDFVQGIWGDLPDIMKAPYRIAQWFYQHGLKNGEFDFLTLWHYLFDFDSQTAYNLWSSNKYGDFILDVRDFFSNLISSITGVTASDRVFFTISLGNHFGVNIPDIEIDFSWYASIRDQFLPYLMAFLYVSVLWLFFKRLPDILKGVAGAESSFVDSLPYDTHSTTYNGEGIFTSNTHVSYGGRTRVTHNSYKKL